MRNRRPARRSARVTAVALFALCSASAVGAQQTERFTIVGERVAIYNIAGSVRIESGTGSQVVVEVRRGGADADRLRVDERTVDGRSALVVRYPDDDVVYAGGGRRGSFRTTLNVRDDGTFYGNRDGGRRIVVHGSGSGTEAHADLRILVPAGRSVDLRLGIGDVSAADVTGDLDIDVGAAAVDTRSTRGRLRVDTGSGSVSVAGAQGDVHIDTGSGRVELNDIAGDALNVDTGSGAVTGAGIRAGRVTIDTGSGSVSLTGIATTDLEVDTGSGAVEIDLTSAAERVHIDTGSGGVRLAVPRDFSARFEIEARGIDIDVASATVSRRDSDHAQGAIGDGRGSVRIETGSGRVRIVER